MRFTARDPVKGSYKYPLSLHKYLYGSNDPIDKIDPRGEWAFVFGASVSGNFTASDLGCFFNDTHGLNGIGAMVAYNSVILAAMTMISDHVGAGVTFGQSVVAAWDHTKRFNDRDAWSWASMGWKSGGASVSTGIGASITGDFGLSNAKHVSQLGGRFVEGGGSFTFRSLYSVGGSFSVGLNPDNSLSDIWLATVSVGVGTPGWEGHGYIGNAEVREYEF